MAWFKAARRTSCGIPLPRNSSAAPGTAGVGGGGGGGWWWWVVVVVGGGGGGGWWWWVVVVVVGGGGGFTAFLGGFLVHLSFFGGFYF